jgi:hypothetical protein
MAGHQGHGIGFCGLENRGGIAFELSNEVDIAKEGRLTSPIARKNQEHWIKSSDALQSFVVIGSMENLPTTIGALRR